MCVFCGMSRRGFARLAGAASLSLLHPWPTKATTSGQQEKVTTILEIRLPDSDVALAAQTMMQAASPPFLFNHCLRTFFLGMINARKKNLKVDEEAGFVGSILHDVALNSSHAGDPTNSFEENSSKVAEMLATKHQFSHHRAEMVVKAILYHAGKATGMGDDIEFVMVGAYQDVFGPTAEQVSDSELAAIERAAPRLGFKPNFISLLGDHVRRSKKPTWTADFVANPPSAFLANRWPE